MRLPFRRPSRRKAEHPGNEGILDAWCTVCQEVRKHKLLDPGSCQCTHCGRIEQLTRPLQPGEEVRG